MGSNWDNWKREDYHPNFAKRSRYRKRRVKYTCEKCGAKRGETRLSKTGRTYKVMVAAAHVNHDPENARAQLIILCQTCHLDHDVFAHVRSKKRNDREKQIQAGQLELPLKFKEKRRKRRNNQ